MRPALWIALAFTLVRAFFAAVLDLAPDEAYYWEWSRSPALAYYDQGPGLSLAIRLGTALLGHTELGVRLVSLLAGLGVSMLAAWFCVRAFNAPGLASWMVLAFNTMLLYSVGGLLMMHDSLLVLCWALTLFAAAQVALGGNRAWWLAAGLFCGLAILSKHTAAMLPGCLLLMLALDKAWRPELKSPWLWAGALLAACGALPILLWNAEQGWPSFQHVGSLAGGDPSRRGWGTPLEFLGSQLGLVTPLLLYIALWGLKVEWARWRGGQASRPESLFFFSSAPVLLFFLMLSFRTRVEGNWPAPAWIGALMLGGGFLHFARGMRPLWLSRGALVLAGLFSALVYLQAARPFLPFPRKWHKLDSASRVDGWKELGQRVFAERSRLGRGAFTAVRTYQNAAELAFYQPGQERVAILQDGSINHQYRFWNELSRHAEKDAVLACGQDWEIGEMANFFKKVERLEDEVFLRNGIEVRRTQVWIGRGFRTAR